MANLANKGNNDLLAAILAEGQNAGAESVNTGSNHIILKINYEDCDIPAGVWVYGQKISNDVVEFAGNVPGELVKEKRIIDGAEREIVLQKNAIVPLVIRQRHNLYNMKNPDVNCTSPLFRSNYEKIYGDKHGYPCNDGSCPYKDKDLDIRCKLEFVVFGIIPTDEEDIPVVMYIKGSSFMPLLEWKKGANTGTFEINGKSVQKPVKLCTYYLTLGSVPKKNGTARYFQGYFEKGDMITDVNAFKKYVDMADGLVDMLESQAHQPANQDVDPKSLPNGTIGGNMGSFIGDDVEDLDDVKLNVKSVIVEQEEKLDEIEKLKQELAALKKSKQG